VAKFFWQFEEVANWETAIRILSSGR